MPELPEVETTRRGLERHISGKTIIRVVVRNANLRQRVPLRLARELPGHIFRGACRRGKYLLLRTDNGTVIVHLGMSGSLCVVGKDTPPGKHDHVDIELESGRCLRFTDPRRFGLVLWTRSNPLKHPLLKHLGPEPLGSEINGTILYTQSRGCRVAIKQWIMNARVMVGVGNIYANEALFAAAIHPQRAAGRISLQRYCRLSECIKEILQQAINMGGTTLRDFTNSEGRPGYFRQELSVYGRDGEPCSKCGAVIRRISQGKRSTWYCVYCQR